VALHHAQPEGWQCRIVADPAIHHGQVVMHGTRMPVTVILGNLAAGNSPEEIVASYPTLTLADVRAATAYAAALAVG